MYGNLIVDDNGMPIPQTVDQQTQGFAPLYSSGGAMAVQDITLQEGIRPVRLVDTNGVPLPISNSVPVVLSDKNMNIQVFDGSAWVPYTTNLISTLVDKQSISGTGFTSPAIQNLNKTAAVLIANITTATTGSINKVTIQIEIGESWIDYKFYDVTWGLGAHTLTIKADSDFVLPAKFRIVLSHSDTTALTYSAVLHLV